MSKNWGVKSLLLIIVLLLLVAMFRLPFVWQWLYPIYYPDIIQSNATKFQHDPNLLLAIIQTESKFSGDETSKKGAIGLMQIMSDTAEWILEKGGYPSNYREELHNPTINVELGSWYLRYLMELYNEDLIVVLAAYNAGPGNVTRWLMSKQWDGSLESLSQVPYGETRHFIQRVLYTYDGYNKVYNKQYWQIAK